MKITDIVELAKQGYTPADIKELMSLNIQEPVQPTLTQVQEDTSKEPAKSEPTPSDPVEPEKAEPAIDNSINYKEMYESTKIELEKLQNNNIHSNIKGEQEDGIKSLNALVSSFM